MTTTAPPSRPSDEPADAALEIATTGTDALRASITVAGVLDESSVGLLACMLRSHLAAGRRYLRVDFAGAEIASGLDAAIVDALLPIHHSLGDRGGMLALENAVAHTADAARAALLLVNGPG